MPSAYAATRDGIDVMLRDRGLRRTTPEQTTESLLRGAHASAVLEGSASTLEEVRGGDGDAVAQAAVRVSTELLALVPVWGRAPVQALARIHALTGGADPGRPVAGDGAARLQTLARTVLATRAPALVVAAVVHAELVTAAPSPRATASWRGPPSGSCWSPGGRPRVAGGARGGGTWRCARRTSPTCAATATVVRRAGTRGCSTAAEAQSAGAEASPLRG